MKQKYLPERTVTVERDGKTYHGYYTVDGQLLTVRFGLEAKSSLLSGDRPESLAVLLLSELVGNSLKDS